MPEKPPSHQPDYVRAYRAANRERINAAKRAWYRTEKGRAKHKAYARATYQRNKDKIKARVRAWQQANPERKNASKRKRYHENHAHNQAKALQYAKTRKLTGKQAAYREKIREKQRAWARQRAAEASDAYAREQLAKYSPISAKDFPQALVEVKKLEIKLKRQIRSHEKCNSAT